MMSCLKRKKSRIEEIDFGWKGWNMIIKKKTKVEGSTFERKGFEMKIIVFFNC